MEKITFKSIENIDQDVVFDVSSKNGYLLKDIGAKSGVVTEDFKTEKDLFNENTFEAEFEQTIIHDDRLDYELAAACGALSSLLDIFYVGKLTITKANALGNEKADKIVKRVAKNLGCKSDSIEKCVSFLENYKMPGDAARNEFGGGLQHHLRDFTHHPTIVGLIFSIVAQFTGTVYGTDTDGSFKFVKIDMNDPSIGKDVPQKILYGTVNWYLHLVSDFDGSHKNAGMGTGIPGPILSFIKEFSVLLQKSNMKIPYGKEGDITVSEFISKLFNGTYIKDPETGKGIRFDLRTEMGIKKSINKQLLPVVCNEIGVRVIYSMSQIYKLIKAKKILTFEQLLKTDGNLYLPFNNPKLTKMLTVATGVFSAIDLSQAALAAAMKSEGSKAKFIGEFVSRINIPGIGRFVISLGNSSGYIFQDFKNTYKEYQQKVYTIHRGYCEMPQLFSIVLTEEQKQLLLSLEYQMLITDLSSTKDSTEMSLKQLWIDGWKADAVQALAHINQVLITDEKEFFESFDLMVEKSNSLSCAQEILLQADNFKLYIEKNKNTKYKKVKYNNKYLEDVFVERQDYIKRDDLNKLRSTYKQYIGIISGQKSRTMSGLIATALITVATGGAAAVFAPGIAVALIGESFAGVYGAALTSASLAALGGGSLVAGGLGVAGGTAMVAGGGAMIGLIGGGAISATSVVFGSSKDLTLDCCARLLTIIKLSNTDNDECKVALHAISENITIAIGNLENDIDVLKDNLGVEDRNYTKEINVRIKESTTSLSYLKRTNIELKKLI